MPKKVELIDKDVIEYYSTHRLCDTASYFHVKTNRIKDILKNNNIEPHTEEKNKKLSQLKSIEMCGVAHHSKLESIKTKKCNTYIERYGVDNPSKLNWVKNKKENTCLTNYEVLNPSQSNIIKSRKEKTYKEHFGVTNPMKSKELSKKAYNTKYEKYGGKNKYKIHLTSLQTETCMKKYGVPNYASSLEFHKNSRKLYLYDGITFDSKPELAYYIYCIDNHMDISRCPESFEYFYNGKKHYYIPDFICNGELIEIKGDQFFNGDKMINPFNRDEDDLYEAKHQCMINNNVKILRYKDYISAINHVNNKYTSYFMDLFNTKIEFPYPNKNFTDKSDMGIIKYFHKSIYSANRDKHKSPVEAWDDKEIVRKTALNRLKYVGNCRPEDIVYGFSVAKFAPKVSVFNSKLASNLIEKYLNEYNTIFDPFSGFSGRLIGAFRCGKSYIGQDINVTHIGESNAVINYLGINNSNVIVKDIFNSEGQYDCLFTCPPYGNIEHWNDTDVNFTCDEWITNCMNRFKCKAYLFVVDDTEEYKDFIVEELTNSSHFGINTEKVIFIRSK